MHYNEDKTTRWRPDRGQMLEAEAEAKILASSLVVRCTKLRTVEPPAAAGKERVTNAWWYN